MIIMARETDITQDRVNAVAEAIKGEGGTPTARKVREHLGNTGSMATILKFLQVWKTGQAVATPKEVVLPESLQRSIVDFIESEVKLGQEDLQVELAAIQQAQADLIAESERQTNEIVQHVQASELAQNEKAVLLARITQLQADVAKATDDAARERQAAESARTDVAVLKSKLEGAETQLATANKDLDAVKREAKASGEEAAELRGRLAALESKSKS